MEKRKINLVEVLLGETIRKVNGKYAVYPEKGGRRLGTHSTRKAAEKQLTAIHLNKESVEANYTKPNFELDPELANKVYSVLPNVSKEEVKKLYSEYLSTIFPHSKVKDIFYHGTSSKNKFDKFNSELNSFGGYYFSKNREVASKFGSAFGKERIIMAILNVSNPLELVDTSPEMPNHMKVTYEPFKDNNYDYVSYRTDFEGDRNYQESVVKNSEQIHILGTKKDIEGFKEFLNTKRTTLREVKYIKPNFEFEWEEAVRYPEFKEMVKESWIKIARKGKPVKFNSIKSKLGNVDLDFDSLEEPKKHRFTKAFQNNKVETPIAVKFSNNDYDLVAGNTRLSGLVKNGVDPYVWIVDISNISESKHEPMNPGILKKRLGKLSCSKVRAEKAKLKDKGTTYAKALQRYLNYHCQ